MGKHKEDKKDSAPVQQGQYYAKAIYHTKWDDGSTTIESECVVDLLNREVVSISQERDIDSIYSDEDVDDLSTVLDAQYVIFPDGETYPVVEDDTFDGVVCGDEVKVPFKLKDKPGTDSYEAFMKRVRGDEPLPVLNKVEMIKNIYGQIFQTNILANTLENYGMCGFRLVTAQVMPDGEGRPCLFLFFTKEQE